MTNDEDIVFDIQNAMRNSGPNPSDPGSAAHSRSPPSLGLKPCSCNPPPQPWKNSRASSVNTTPSLLRG